MWNRHFWPEDISASTRLADLDLDLYTAATGQLLQQSRLTDSNVEQLASDATGDVVVRVSTAETGFPAGRDREDFAIAFSQDGYQEANGPLISLTCSTPATTLPISISCTARNTGDLTAWNVAANLALGSSTSSSANASFGALSPGASALRTMAFPANLLPGTYAYQVTAQHFSYGELEATRTSGSLQIRETRPTLRISASQVDFTLAPSATSTAQTIELTSSGGLAAPLLFTAQTTSPWIAVTTSSAMSPATLRVSTRSAGLTAGRYSGKITLRSTGASNDGLEILVSLVVQQPTVRSEVTDAIFTRQLSNPVCATPNSVFTFTSRDSLAKLWFLYRVNAGDRLRMTWITPSGNTYRETNWVNEQTGNFCNWDDLPIMNTNAANLFGFWTARIYLNDSLALTRYFAISPVTVSSVMTTRLTLLDSCAAPSPISTFFTYEPSASLWFSIADARTGDIAAVEWYSPDGLHSTITFNPVRGDGSNCFLGRLSIAGTAAQRNPGDWSAVVTWNGSPIAFTPFQIR